MSLHEMTLCVGACENKRDFFKKVVILEKRKALKRAMFRNQFFCLEKSKHRMFVFDNSPLLKLESTETKENLLPQTSTKILLCFLSSVFECMITFFFACTCDLNENLIFMIQGETILWLIHEKIHIFSWMGGHFPEFVITDTRHKKVIG